MIHSLGSATWIN